MKPASKIIKHSVLVGGIKTSISLEDEFWTAFKSIAAGRCVTVSALLGEIDQARPRGRNLSSAMRVFVLQAKERKAA